MARGQPARGEAPFRQKPNVSRSRIPGNETIEFGTLYNTRNGIQIILSKKQPLVNKETVSNASRKSEGSEFPATIWTKEDRWYGGKGFETSTGVSSYLEVIVGELLDVTTTGGDRALTREGINRQTNFSISLVKERSDDENHER